MPIPGFLFMFLVAAAMRLVTATEERESWPSVPPYTAKGPLPNIVPFPATAALGFSSPPVHLHTPYTARLVLSCLAFVNFYTPPLVCCCLIGDTTCQTFILALM